MQVDLEEYKLAGKVPLYPLADSMPRKHNVLNLLSSRSRTRGLKRKDPSNERSTKNQKVYFKMHRAQGNHHVMANIRVRHPMTQSSDT